MPDEETPKPAPKVRLIGGTLVRGFKTLPARAGGPVLTGEVRPPTPREVAEYLRKLRDAAAPGDDVKARADFYAAHVTAWDAVAADGTPAPVTAAAMMDLDYPTWAQLEDVAMGYGGEELLGKSEPSSAS